MIGVQHRACVQRIQTLFGPLRPRDGEQPVEIRADGRRFGVRVADPLQPGELTLGLQTDRLRHARSGNLSAVVLGYRPVVFAKLLADRVHLAAQKIFALLLLRAALHVIPDPLADHELGEPVLLKLNGQLEPLHDVERFQQLDLTGAWMRDRSHECADPALVIAPEPEDLFDNRPILPLQLAREGRGHRGIGTLVDFDAEHALAIGVRGTGDGAMQRDERYGCAVASKPDPVRHLRHYPDLGVCAALSRYQQYARIAADVDRHRDRHAGKHDRVIQWNDSESTHDSHSIGPLLDIVNYYHRQV